MITFWWCLAVSVAFFSNREISSDQNMALKLKLCIRMWSCRTIVKLCCWWEFNPKSSQATLFEHYWLGGGTFFPCSERASLKHKRPVEKGLWSLKSRARKRPWEAVLRLRLRRSSSKNSPVIFPDTRRLEVCGHGGRSLATLRVLHRDDGGHHRHPDGRAPHLRVRRPRQNHRHLSRQIVHQITEKETIISKRDSATTFQWTVKVKAAFASMVKDSPYPKWKKEFKIIYTASWLTTKIGPPQTIIHHHPNFLAWLNEAQTQ